MKRLTIFLSIVVCGVLLATVVAFMQSDSRPQFGAPKDSQQRTAPPDALPQSYFNKNRLHKLIIRDQDTAIYNQLVKTKAIRQEIEYGGYKLVVVDEEAAGGRAVLQAMPITPRDDQDMIALNGYLIDTSNPQQISRELPVDLKQSRMNQTPAAGAVPGKGLYVIQFIGPIQDPWLKTLEETGAKLIAYIPNNAYIVRADQVAAGMLAMMKNRHSFVQWMGDYQPAYKLTPQLQAMREMTDAPPVRVRVQVIDSSEGRLKAEEIKKAALQYFGERRVLKYRNLTVLIPVSQLAELSQSDEVLAIEEDRERKRADEVQGQIVAGNLTGNAPSSPGYLAWLASKGFNSSQFGSFSVNVADDSFSLTGHPDLQDSRVAFENNPTNMTGPQHGHGFLNSHIIGGFNNGTGSVFEDANGFNYGLGIVPWARVGVTAIFGPGPVSPSAWEETAYSQSARISSNSWLLDFTWHYDTFAQEYDSIVRDAQSGTPGNQELAVVFCAGNDARFGSGTVTSPGTAKNVITVGASENLRQTGVDGCTVDNLGADSASDIAFFSSRGPVYDGRIKPDIVAPGAHIQAGIPQSNYDGANICDQYFPAGQTLYSWSSGTSHSTPAVAGGASLIYQDYLNKGLAAPSPAMIKALLMNSASYMTGDGANDTLPSNNQGMGLMNLGRTFDGASRLLTDQTQTFSSSGDVYRVFGTVASTDRPFRVTLAWTDAPGTPVSAPWVNNLDLEVMINGQTYTGNVFSGASSTPGGAPDSKNNVESVFLPPGVSGNFVVIVRGVNIAGDGVPGNDDPTDQDFALVVYNATPATPDSPVIDVAPSRLSFTATAGGDNPPDQTLNISNIGGDTLNWTATADAPWLTVSPASGAAPSTLTVSVNTSGLAAGTYNSTVTIGSANAFNTPVRVPILLTLTPVFGASPSLLNFQAIAGDSNPPAQPINISNNDSVPRSWTASADAPWLAVTPTSGTAPSTLTVSVNTTSLKPGTYNGNVTVTPTHLSNSPISVSIVLIVFSPIAAFPTSLDFIAQFGAGNPPNQSFSLYSFSAQAQDWTASDDAPWLTVSPTSGAILPGSAPFTTLTTAVNISGLAVGTHTATITIIPTKAPDPPIKVIVRLTVNRLLNGGFEGSISPWVLSGVAQRSTGGYPHSGTGYLLMGAANSSSGSAYQQITISSGLSLNLSFWLNVASDETTTTAQNDKLFIEVRDTSGRLLRTLATFSNLDKSTPGNYLLRGDYSLASFAGQTVRVHFRTTTNSSLLTSFRVDDVSIR